MAQRRSSWPVQDLLRTDNRYSTASGRIPVLPDNMMQNDEMNFERRDRRRIQMNSPVLAPDCYGDRCQYADSRSAGNVDMEYPYQQDEGSTYETVDEYYCESDADDDYEQFYDSFEELPYENVNMNNRGFAQSAHMQNEFVHVLHDEKFGDTEFRQGDQYDINEKPIGREFSNTTYEHFDRFDSGRSRNTKTDLQNEFLNEGKIPNSKKTYRMGRPTYRFASGDAGYQTEPENRGYHYDPSPIRSRRYESSPARSQSHFVKPTCRPHKVNDSRMNQNSLKMNF